MIRAPAGFSEIFKDLSRLSLAALAEEASVAGVAQAHGVNANLLFNWCRQYRAVRLAEQGPSWLGGTLGASD